MGTLMIDKPIQWMDFGAFTAVQSLPASPIKNCQSNAHRPDEYDHLFL